MYQTTATDDNLNQSGHAIYSTIIQSSEFIFAASLYFLVSKLFVDTNLKFKMMINCYINVI